jgi:SAM-dependent methyltransferase
MFWVLFLEIMRVLKPGGLLYLNVPSNGEVHRWPVDCWRFYPDSGRALVTWAQRNGVSAALLESFVSHQHPDGPTPGNAREYADDEFQWNDFIGVFLRDESHVPSYTQRMVDTRTDFTNGLKYGQEGFIHPARRSEDQTQLARVREERPSLLKALGIR